MLLEPTTRARRAAFCVDVPDEAQHKNGTSFVASMYVCGLLDRGVVLWSPGTTEMRHEQKGSLAPSSFPGWAQSSPRWHCRALPGDGGCCGHALLAAGEGRRRGPCGLNAALRFNATPNPAAEFL